MRKSFLLFLLLFPLIGLSSSGAESSGLKVFTLNDNSQIKGRLIGVENGRYLVESTSLGNVSILESNVVSITNLSGTDSPASVLAVPSGGQETVTTLPSQNTEIQGEVADLQKHILADESLMTDIQSLTRDEEFMGLLSDPEILDAVANSDLEKIRNNPKAMQLLNHPKMQEIIQKTSQKYGGQ